jgi:CDP-glucose 4,6-dehydratase
VESVVSRLCSLLGSNESWAIESTVQPHEAQMLMLDSGLARRRLGWRPLLTLDESLSLVAEWQKAFALGSDMRAVSLAQIARVAGKNEEIADG